jgi:hypothetical protein
MSSEGDDWGKWNWVKHNINSTIFIQILIFFALENQLDSDNEKEEESKKAKASSKFDDEDKVDPE